MERDLHSKRERYEAGRNDLFWALIAISTFMLSLLFLLGARGTP